VTPFNIASRLTSFGTTILANSAGVLTPLATVLHAEEKHDRQRALLLEGGRYCLAMATFLVVLFVVLGRSIITVWMGARFEAEFGPSRLLAILALGEALPMSQFVATSIVLGIGRHKLLALVNLGECAVALGLAWVLIGPYGLTGVCVAFAIPAAIFRGVVQLVYNCRVVGTPVGRYLRGTFAPTVAVAVPPAAALAAAVAWCPPTTFPTLAAYAGAYAVCHFGASAALLLGPERLQLLVSVLTKKASGVGSR
jgi:O-antigen/teichoic acid export membrane protein